MRLLIFFILLLFSFSIADAQKIKIKPDFSGKWVMDEKKSKIADGFWDYELVIIHADPELKITHRSLVKGEDKSADVIYFTDRRGEKTYPYAYYPEVEETSETYWKGNSIVRKYKTLGKGEKPVKSETTETYVLSKDQKTLTVTVDRFSLIPISIPPLEGKVIQKFIYKKQ